MLRVVHGRPLLEIAAGGQPSPSLLSPSLHSFHIPNLSLRSRPLVRCFPPSRPKSSCGMPSIAAKLPQPGGKDINVIVRLTKSAQFQPQNVPKTKIVWLIGLQLLSRVQWHSAYFTVPFRMHIINGDFHQGRTGRKMQKWRILRLPKILGNRTPVGVSSHKL